MATVINAAQVVADFGAYYINAGQNENDIHNAIREKFDSMSVFTVVDSEDTVLRAANATFAEALQSFQKAFTPKGGITFTPEAIPLFNVKVDESFYPDDLKYSWIQFLTSNNLDRTTWPFVRYFIEEYVLGQILTDLEKNLYGAVYAAPTPGTAGAASAAFNGLKKIINDAITAATITPIVTGAPSATPATWAGQVETFTAGIPELYWDNVLNLNMSRSLKLRYIQGRRTKYNSNWGQTTQIDVVQDFEQVKINGFGSMTGQTKIWGTPKANAIMALKGGSNMNIVEVEKVDRQVKVYTDFWIGFGFIDPSKVYTNDQDLPA